MSSIYVNICIYVVNICQYMASIYVYMSAYICLGVKETHSYGKRDLIIWSRGTYLYANLLPETSIYIVKRDLSKEMCSYGQKRCVHMRSIKRDVFIWSKETYSHDKRDLFIKSQTWRCACRERPFFSMRKMT